MFASFSIFDLHDCQRWLPLKGKLSPKVTDEVKMPLQQHLPQSSQGLQGLSPCLGLTPKCLR